MPVLNVSKSFDRRIDVTPKVRQVMRMFGLSAERLRDGVTYNCRLHVNAGDIVYITGPSGAGKSVLLTELQEAVPACERINLSQIELACGQAVIDCVEGDFLSALRLLSITGLNDVSCVLNQPASLSEGQKYRFRLAMAIASGKNFIFADEFCSNLDRISACGVSYNIRKFASRKAVTFILASSHGDILADLQPDVLVVRQLSGAAEVIYKNMESRI